MSIQDLGSIGELVAAIATVATLAYLAIQIRSSTNVSKAQSLQTVLDGARDRVYLPSYNNPEISETFSRGMTEFEMMSDAEQRRFYWLMNEWVFQLQNVTQLYSRGLMDQVDHDAWLYAIASMVKTPGGRQAWKYMEATITPTIKETINSYLVANPDLPPFLELIPLMKFRGDSEA
jgi:hypothetical protein